MTTCRYIFVPVEGDIEVRATDRKDPYALYHELGDDQCATMLRTSYTNVFLFVDDTADLKNLKVNPRASLFHPLYRSLRGDAIFVLAPLVDSGTEDGYDHIIHNMDDNLIVRLLAVLNS